MARRIRRSFTFIEIVISLALVGSIFFFLSLNLKNLVVTRAKVMPLKEHILRKNQMTLKLHRVFTEICLDPTKSGGNFFTFQAPLNPSPILIFHFDNSVDINPHFTGIVKGSLHLENDHLFLSLKSFEGKEVEKLLLFSQVKALNFSFFDAKEKRWLSHWSKECTYFPLLIKISLSLDDKDEIFSFYTTPGVEVMDSL